MPIRIYSLNSPSLKLLDNVAITGQDKDVPKLVQSKHFSSFTVFKIVKTVSNVDVYVKIMPSLCSTTSACF